MKKSNKDQLLKEKKELEDKIFLINKELAKDEPSEKEIQDAESKIKELTDIAYKAIAEAEEIAKKYELSFRFSLGYGMGGTYIGSDSDWSSSSRSC